MANSIGIQKWAGDMAIELQWERGTGDARQIGWSRDDGDRAIETNGDPVFSHQDGFEAAWELGTVPVATEYGFSFAAENPDIHPTSGTLDDAIALANEIRSTVTLTDEPGFKRGWVHPGGKWTLT